MRPGRLSPQERDRALGALLGVALGDALGMPSQTMTRERIRGVYGVIEDFVAPAREQKVSAGLPAAAITDDTEQTLLLARHLIARRGGFDEAAWAEELLDWERETHARGVNDLLGPSTKAAIAGLRRGVPASETGRNGTTNGAAMRITPVGIAFVADPPDRFLAAVAATCRLTHNTPVALGAAAAVGAAVSAGVSGADFETALPVALAAAGANTEMAARIEAALALAREGEGFDHALRVAERIGVSVAAVESVPMAFAVARLARGDAWRAARIAANIGDDTDTIGAIAAGMCGACGGAARMPADKVETLVATNRLDLAPVVEGLLALRHGSAP